MAKKKEKKEEVKVVKRIYERAIKPKKVEVKDDSVLKGGPKFTY